MGFHGDARYFIGLIKTQIFNKKMLKAVIFDLGNVLVDFDHAAGEVDDIAGPRRPRAGCVKPAPQTDPAAVAFRREA